VVAGETVVAVLALQKVVPPNVAAASPTDASREPIRPVVAPVRFRRVTLSINPMSLLISRLGLNAEYLPAKHHALAVTPYYQPFSYRSTEGSAGPPASNAKLESESLPAWDLEAGYRIYTGATGANGFFAGAAVLFYTGEVRTVHASGKTDVGHATGVGAALDIGGNTSSTMDSPSGAVLDFCTTSGHSRVARLKPHPGRRRGRFYPVRSSRLDIRHKRVVLGPRSLLSIRFNAPRKIAGYYCPTTTVQVFA